MAGDYDLLSVQERANALKSIRDELDMCIKANASLKSHFNRVMSNKDVVDWLQMWDDLEQKIAIARTHATAAQSQLTELLTLDSIYPYFSLQYEWQIGRGGISAVVFTASDDKMQFYTPSVDYNGSVVPTAEVTAGDLVKIENTESNNLITEIVSVTATSITTAGPFVDEQSPNARIRVIRRTI